MIIIYFIFYSPHMNKQLLIASALIASTALFTSTFAQQTNSFQQLREKLAQYNQEKEWTGSINESWWIDHKFDKWFENEKDYKWHDHKQGTGSTLNGKQEKNDNKAQLLGGPQGDPKELLDSTEIKAAIKANDYNAFVTAFNNQLAKITTPTKEEFAKMVANYPKKQWEDKYAPLQSAIKANDYDAFVTAFKTLKPSNITETIIPTKEEFANLVDMAKKHDAVQSAIKANDYDTFVKAFEANKPTVPTQEEFNKIVSLKQNIKDNRSEIKTIKTEVKTWTATKDEAKEKISSIKDENAATKKALRLAKKPVRKVWRLSK